MHYFICQSEAGGSFLPFITLQCLMILVYHIDVQQNRFGHSDQETPTSQCPANLAQHKLPLNMDCEEQA